MKSSIVGGEKWKWFFTLNSEYSCLIALQQLKSFEKTEMEEWIQTKHCNVPVLPLKAQYMGTILKRVGTLSSFPTFPPSIGCLTLILPTISTQRTGGIGLFFFAYFSHLGNCFSTISENPRALIHHHPDSPDCCHKSSDLILYQMS